MTHTNSKINFKKLWRIVTKNRINSRVHGPEHWTRVERNGLYISERKLSDIMESKPSDLAVGNLVTSKSKGLDSKNQI